MVRKTKQEALETKEKILDAAEHVFYRKGVALSGLEDIAREAGMTRGAIYWHFKNKADLFHAMHERIHLPLEDIVTRIAQTPSAESIAQLQQVCIDVVHDLERDERKQRIFSVLLLKCDFSGDMADTMERIKNMHNAMTQTMAQLFEGCRKKNLISSPLSSELLAQSLCSFMSGLLRNYLMDPSEFSAANVEIIIRRFFETMICNA